MHSTPKAGGLIQIPWYRTNSSPEAIRDQRERLQRIWESYKIPPQRREPPSLREWFFECLDKMDFCVYSVLAFIIFLTMDLALSILFNKCS